MPRDESNIFNDLIVDLIDTLYVSEVFDDVLLAVIDRDQRGLVGLANQGNYACCHVTLGKLQVFADVFAGLVGCYVAEVEELCAADVENLELITRQSWAYSTKV